jgi:hypothetical protein
MVVVKKCGSAHFFTRDSPGGDRLINQRPCTIIGSVTDKHERADVTLELERTLLTSPSPSPSLTLTLTASPAYPHPHLHARA